MKKLFFIAILPLIVILTVVSCSGTPQSRGSSPVLEAPGGSSRPSEETPPLEDEFHSEEFGDIGDTVDIGDMDEIAGIYEDTGWEDGYEEDEFDGIAEAGGEGEEPPAEGELLAGEPAADEDTELPVVTAVPAPPSAPPPSGTPPPVVTARPLPPQATPPPQVTPPSPATPRPPSSQVTPPSPATPPPAGTPIPPSSAQTPPPAAPPPSAREPLPDTPELSNPTPAFRGRPDDEVVFSRTVRATVGQLVVVPFRGTGWVYLGEAGAKRGIAYDSRRLDPEGQSFIFRTEEPGEYALKFFRQDFIRDFSLNDYVQVIVGDPPETAGTGWFNPLIDRGRVIAEPRWPTSLEEAQAIRGNTQPPQSDPAPVAPPAPVAQERPPVQPPAQTPPAPQAPAQTPPAVPPAPQTPAQTPPAPPAPQAAAQTPPAQTPPPEPPPQLLTLEPGEYLQKAKDEFDAGRVDAAIAYLDRFSEYLPVESDEVLWLYGQFYEANSPSRNILTALDSYRRLTREYPQSSRYDAARRRIAYLQRYYINIQ